MISNVLLNRKTSDNRNIRLPWIKIVLFIFIIRIFPASQLQQDIFCQRHKHYSTLWFTNVGYVACYFKFISDHENVCDNLKLQIILHLILPDM